MAAVATQVPKALSLISHLPVADMAAQRKQVLTVEERESRAQAFFEGLTDPDRLADAMAGLTRQAWANDIVANMEDPPADAVDTDLYLGNIPVKGWRHVRENAPSLDWLGCYELWHRLYAHRRCGDVESDFTDPSSAARALAGWPKLVYELIQDMVTLKSLTKQGHALDVTKECDLMYRVFLLQDGCGYITIYPNTVKILENFFTPALVRLPPPTDVRSHVLIAGDLSLALWWFNKKTKKAARKATFEEPLRAALYTEPRCAGLRVLMNWGHQQDRPVHRAGTCWPLYTRRKAWTSSCSGPVTTFTGPRVHGPHMAHSACVGHPNVDTGELAGQAENPGGCRCTQHHFPAGTPGSPVGHRHPRPSGFLRAARGV